MALADKLAPQRFTAMSGKMAAIVGYIIDAPYTDPAITDLIVTTSGGVLACTTDDPLADDFIGHVSDLERNWTNLLKAADLTKAERKQAEALYAKRVHRA